MLRAGLVFILGYRGVRYWPGIEEGEDSDGGDGGGDDDNDDSNGDDDGGDSNR